jgi:tetratricopeptide (TPR) repeat protein
MIKSAATTGGLIVLILFGGCSQSSVVKVTRHGGMDLDSSMVLTVGSVSGDQDKEFRHELRKALRANPDVKVVSDVQGGEALTDSIYASLASTMANRGQNLVVIAGRYRLDTDDSHKEKEGPDNKKIKYIERTFTGRFEFTISDVLQHTLSYSRDVQASSSEEKDESWLLNTLVDAIITDPMIANVRQKVIDEFMYELYPHEEVYNAKFYYDSDMPELERGIAYAKIGKWDDAIILFADAASKYPENKNVHKAFYNLGIAYKWNFKFPEARENLEKAFLLNDSSEYYNEVQSLDQFEQEYLIRQKEQGQPGK